MPTMSRLKSLLIAGVVATGLVAGAILAGGGSAPAGSSPTPDPTVFGGFVPINGCLEEMPAEVVGKPLTGPPPLPEGAYMSHRYEPDPAPGIIAAQYTIPVSLDDFVSFVLERWPDAGWSLGRGEREAGEAESVFFLPDRSRYGQFRARTVYCDLDAVEVTLTLGEQSEAPPAPKGS
jgi:hypothetical protein